jgi:uncharacterized membrane protein YphA (DoxX/SURF4 family)
MTNAEGSSHPGRNESLSTKNRRGVTPILIIGVLLGLFFAVVGLLKLLDLPMFARAYADAGQPRWIFFGSGAIELLAGAALILPRFRTFAAWTLLGMIFLISWHPWTAHQLIFFLPQTISISLLIFLVWLPSRSAVASSPQ